MKKLLFVFVATMVLSSIAVFSEGRNFERIDLQGGFGNKDFVYLIYFDLWPGQDTVYLVSVENSKPIFIGKLEQYDGDLVVKGKNGEIQMRFSFIWSEINEAICCMFYMTTDKIEEEIGLFRKM